MSYLPMFLNMFIILPFLAFLVVLFVLMAREEQNNMENKHNAKYAFYYLLSLVALIFTALSVGMVAFNIIDKTVADTILSYRSVGDGSLKFAISALLIAAPIFYILSLLISKGIKKGELDKESPLRRWLTYFILLVSSLIILGAFIGVINNFLSGELTTRFVLKALSVLIISGTTFSYYFYEAKRTTAGEKDAVVKVFGWASLAVVLAAFIAAWFFVESPVVARQRRLDDTLVNNMRQIESAVNEYYSRNDQLPASLDELKSSSVYLTEEATIDPETGQEIEYKRFNEEDYELCATFRLSSRDTSSPSYYPGDTKQHEAGYQCLPGELFNVDVKGRTL